MPDSWSPRWHWVHRSSWYSHCYAHHDTHCRVRSPRRDRRVITSAVAPSDGPLICDGRKGTRSTAKANRLPKTVRTYALRSSVHCAVCERRMESTTCKGGRFTYLRCQDSGVFAFCLFLFLMGGVSGSCGDCVWWPGCCRSAGWRCPR